MDSNKYVNKKLTKAFSQHAFYLLIIEEPSSLKWQISNLFTNFVPERKVQKADWSVIYMPKASKPKSKLVVLLSLSDLSPPSSWVFLINRDL